jgi:hypothetical protein
MVDFKKMMNSKTNSNFEKLIEKHGISNARKVSSNEKMFEKLNFVVRIKRFFDF